MHTQAKHSKPEAKKQQSFVSSKGLKKIRNIAIVIAVIAVLAFLIFSWLSDTTILPPTDLQGHIEESPLSHVLREPMLLLVQKHMLEHADGKGAPGVVINYNCIEFSCEPGLVEKLEAFAAKYPANVYVAPFPKMSVKIAITKYGKIETMDSLDEAKIDSFIRNP